MEHHALRDAGPARALLVYLAAVFVGGALLAPWLFHGVQALAASFPALAGVADNPFSRFVNRSLLIVAVLGLPFFLRAAGIRRAADAGLDPRRVAWRRLGAGFALGIVSLAAVCAVTLAAGARTLDLSTSPAEFAGRFVSALATAAVVAVLEEMLFRGAIFGTLRRALHWPAALALSSAIYAIVHFLGRPGSPPQVHWDSGVRVLPTMLRAMGDWHAIVPALITLTLAGVILGLAYQATDDLWASIGIHAGWIFWLKFYGFLTNSAPGTDEWVWGTSKLIDGWFALMAIVVVLLVVASTMRRRARPTAP